MIILRQKQYISLPSFSFPKPNLISNIGQSVSSNVYAMRQNVADAALGRTGLRLKLKPAQVQAAESMLVNNTGQAALNAGEKFAYKLGGDSLQNTYNTTVRPMANSTGLNNVSVRGVGNSMIGIGGSSGDEMIGNFLM